MFFHFSVFCSGCQSVQTCGWSVQTPCASLHSGRADGENMRCGEIKWRNINEIMWRLYCSGLSCVRWNIDSPEVYLINHENFELSHLS